MVIVFDDFPLQQASNQTNNSSMQEEHASSTITVVTFLRSRFLQYYTVSFWGFFRRTRGNLSLVAHTVDEEKEHRCAAVVGTAWLAFICTHLVQAREIKVWNKNMVYYAKLNHYICYSITTTWTARPSSRSRRRGDLFRMPHCRH